MARSMPSGRSLEVSGNRNPREMNAVPHRGDSCGKQNSAYGLLRHVFLFRTSRSSS